MYIIVIFNLCNCIKLDSNLLFLVIDWMLFVYCCSDGWWEIIFILLIYNNLRLYFINKDIIKYLYIMGEEEKLFRYVNFFFRYVEDFYGLYKNCLDC